MAIILPLLDRAYTPHSTSTLFSGMERKKWPSKRWRRHPEALPTLRGWKGISFQTIPALRGRHNYLGPTPPPLPATQPQAHTGPSCFHSNCVSRHSPAGPTGLQPTSAFSPLPFWEGPTRRQTWTRQGERMGRGGLLGPFL